MKKSYMKMLTEQYGALFEEDLKSLKTKPVGQGEPIEKAMKPEKTKGKKIEEPDNKLAGEDPIKGAIDIQDAATDSKDAEKEAKVAMTDKMLEGEPKEEEDPKAQTTSDTGGKVDGTVKPIKSHLPKIDSKRTNIDESLLNTQELLMKKIVYDRSNIEKAVQEQIKKSLGILD